RRGRVLEARHRERPRQRLPRRLPHAGRDAPRPQGHGLDAARLAGAGALVLTSSQAPLLHDGPDCAPSAVAGPACGKVILLGEHAVVYGVPALAGALPGGVTVEQTAGRGLVRIPAWALELDLASTVELPTIGRALHAIVERLGLANKLRRDVDLVVH